VADTLLLLPLLLQLAGNRNAICRRMHDGA
jgi:hypothetical protein